MIHIHAILSNLINSTVYLLIGTLLCIQGCTKLETEAEKLGDTILYGGKKNYTITIDPVLDSDGSNTQVWIRAYNAQESSYDDAEGFYDPQSTYHSENIELREYDHLSLILSAETEDFQVGNIWLNRSGRRIKLLTESSLKGDVTFQEFKVDRDLFDRAQEGFGPSMDSYILAGGVQGTESISATKSLHLKLNNRTLEFRDGGRIKPIVFNANSDDILGIIAMSLPEDNLGEIWLHHPDGYAEKINHGLTPEKVHTVESFWEDNEIESYIDPIVLDISIHLNH